MGSIEAILSSSVLLIAVTLVSLVAVLIGLVAIFSVRRERTKTYHEIIVIRDELIKMSIIAALPEEEREKIYPILNEAFARADKEFSSTMQKLFGEDAAQNLIYKLSDRKISVAMP